MSNFSGVQRLSTRDIITTIIDRGWVRTTVLFFALVDQSTSDYVTVPRRHCSLQRRFPTYDTLLLPFEDICNKVAKSRSWKLSFSAPKFWGEGPPKLDSEIFMPLPRHITWKSLEQYPYRPRRYKSKYTTFGQFSNFSLLKNCWGRPIPDEVCVCKHLSFCATCEIFRGRGHYPLVTKI